MSQSANYSVISLGKIKDGFESQQVTNAFATLFKMPPEKASNFLAKKRCVKKDITFKTADAYRQKLNTIGLEVSIIENKSVSANSEQHTAAPKPTTEDPLAHLSLVDATATVAPKTAVQSQSSNETMTCPKCKLEQPKAEECAGCKIIIARAMEIASQESVKKQKSKEEPVKVTYANINDPANIQKVIIFPIIAAVIGAFLWKFIAVNLDVEIGWAAWLIGGGIGFASAVAGGRGNVMGAICTILLAFSIISGKYMAYNVIVDEMLAEVGEMSELLSPEYDNNDPYETEIAEFSKVTDEQTLRVFMVENDYSDATSPSSVTYREIADFKDEIQPDFEYEIESRAATQEAFAELQQSSTSVSVIGVVNSLGIIDLVFLLIGGFTAFRVGRGEFN